MGGWWLLAVYLVLGLLLIASPILRGRILLVPALRRAILDRHRRDPEVDRVGRERGRILSGSGMGP